MLGEGSLRGWALQQGPFREFWRKRGSVWRGGLQAIAQPAGICSGCICTGRRWAQGDTLIVCGARAITAPEWSSISEATCVRELLSDPPLGDLPPEPKTVCQGHTCSSEIFCKCGCGTGIVHSVISEQPSELRF